MKRPVTIALACALSFVFAGTTARAADRSQLGVPDSLKGDALSPSRHGLILLPFKLKGGGQIDLATLEVTFAGQANYLGQFTATGLLDPALGEIAGTITAANGDTVYWTGFFQPGPDGGIEATLTMLRGTGRFAHFDGIVSGPVSLDEDFMFTLDLQGVVSFVEQGY